MLDIASSHFTDPTPHEYRGQGTLRVKLRCADSKAREKSVKVILDE
jgi:hypothetical protein